MRPFFSEGRSAALYGLPIITLQITFRGAGAERDGRLWTKSQVIWEANTSLLITLSRLFSCVRVIGVPQTVRLFFCGCFQIGQDRLSVDLTLLNGLGDLAWDLVVIAVGGWRRLVSAHLIAGVWSCLLSLHSGGRRSLV